MNRRGLSEALVRQTIAAPDSIEEVRAGRVVLQRRYYAVDARKVYLVRPFVDVDRDPAEVVTAYRTSSIRRYWKGTT